MSDSAIKVLLVDDAATIRSALRILIRKQPDMEVVGAAPNGAEGVRLAKALDPDIVIMDIEMPVMTGIEAVRKIMEESPRPILMFSSVAKEAAPVTFEALDAGALDYITKDNTGNSIDIGNLAERLTNRIRALARKREGARTLNVEKEGTEMGPSVGTMPAKGEPRQPSATIRETDKVPSPRRRTARPTGAALPHHEIKLLAIGSSTGGPQALKNVLGALPADFPVPVVVVQHMPETFTASFADRLDSACAIAVKLAEHGKTLIAGQAVIAPGDQHLRLDVDAGGVKVCLDSENVSSTFHKPSVDVMLESLDGPLAPNVLVAILTGMGADGAAAALKLSEKGATVIAQDEASSVVWGMPRAVVEADAADIVLPLDAISNAISFLLKKGRSR